MIRLSGQILSDDSEFRTQMAGALRGGAVPVTVADGTSRGEPPDVVVVDGRADQPSSMAAVERARAQSPGASIFVVALTATPEAILRAMRSGANEFLTWPQTDNALSDALQRASARRESSGGARRQSTVIAFLGAKGGAGTTTVAVNSGVELARLSKQPTAIVDLKPGLGEVALFLGVRSRYSLLDAIDNIHRLDSEFLRELVTKHKSGLEMLAGSEHFERPGPADCAAIEDVIRLLARQYDYVLIDVGCQMTACATAALYSADQIYLVLNPDVPSIRNAQRLAQRIAQLGACGERVRVLVNRAAEPYPIPPGQIESALGRPIDHTFPSDYRTVSSALNSGVPLALTGNSDIAGQFDRFTRRILDPALEPSNDGGARRNTRGLQRIASLW